MNITNIKTTLDNLTVENATPEVINQIVNALTGPQVQQEIKKTQNNLDEGNTIRIQSETKIASYRESYGEIIKELKAMGINPENTNLELLNVCKEIVDISLKLKELTPDIDAIKRQMHNLNQNQGNDVGF